MYKVFKDHAELAEYKTLAAAKKLAEKQHGEVFCDGKKVYPTEQDGSADMAPAIAPDQEEVATAVEATDSTDAIEQEAPDNTSAIFPEKEDNTGRYRIESLMNVRLHPALNADIVGIAQPGTVVTVTGINNDWMAVKKRQRNRVHHVWWRSVRDQDVSPYHSSIPHNFAHSNRNFCTAPS